MKGKQVKYFLDLKDEKEFKEWVLELRELVKIPTDHPEIPGHYRDLLEEWNGLETWQKEELVEHHEEHLTELVSDSAQYCNLQITVEELRNLSDHDLDNFGSFVLVHLPREVIRSRLLKNGIDEEDIQKSVSLMRRMVHDALDHHNTLERIKKLGQ